VEQQRPGQPTAFVLLARCEGEQFILMANKANKLRLLNAATKMCRRVAMGPRLEEPAARILVLPAARYNPASTGASVRPDYALLLCGRELAVTRLPPNGAAHTYCSRQACAVRADDVAVSHDGTGCFVLSRSEESVVQMAIDIGAYEDSLAGENDEAGWARQLESAEVRQLYAELKDYFCVVQLEGGGKELAREIPLDNMEKLCRTLGFFPTEREIEDMINEVIKINIQ
jgi:hypothetical protein